MVDLAIFMGQSNMAGRGEAEQATVCEQGHGFEFRAISDNTRLYDVVEPFGINENNLLSGVSENIKSGSMVTSLMEAYYKVCGVPIVGVSCSKGGTSCGWWSPDKNPFKDAVSRLNSAKEYLLCNEYELRHIFMVWCQGETDGDKKTSAQTYKKQTQDIVEEMIALTGVEKCFMVGIGHRRKDGDLNDTAYDYLIKAQDELCNDDSNFKMVASFKEYRLHMRDMFHYHQTAYNEVGKTAGENIAAYFLKA